MAVNGRFHVEIDAIVLGGVRPADQARAVDAFTRELTRLLTLHGLPDAGDARHDALRGLPALPASRSPRHLGRLLARSVHEALTAGPDARSGSEGPS